MKRIIIVLAGVLFLAPLTLAGVAQATTPSGTTTTTTLGRISLGPYHETSPDFKIFAKDPTDTVVTTTTITPRQLHRLALPPRPGLHRGHPGNAHRLRRRRPSVHAAHLHPRHRLPRPGPGARAHRPQREQRDGHRGLDLPQRATHRLATDRRARTRQLPVLEQRPAEAGRGGLRQTHRTHNLPRTGGHTGRPVNGQAMVATPAIF
jgi:hypothetical protein